MKWAVAMGYRPDNPPGDALGQALGRQQAVVQHMRALPARRDVLEAPPSVRIPPQRPEREAGLQPARSGRAGPKGGAPKRPSQGRSLWPRPDFPVAYPWYARDLLGRHHHRSAGRRTRAAT